MMLTAAPYLQRIFSFHGDARNSPKVGLAPDAAVGLS
jgi:hypothetical protein